MSKLSVQPLTIKTGRYNENRNNADQCFFGNDSKYLVEDGINFLYVKPTYKYLRRPFWYFRV